MLKPISVAQEQNHPWRTGEVNFVEPKGGFGAEHLEANDEYFAATTRGLVRAQNQDAFQVIQGFILGRKKLDLFAVFDGLGGLPNGKAAAQTAARALPQAIASSTGPAQVLPNLSEIVRATGGFTTIVLALFSPKSRKTLLMSCGDSSAYLLRPGAQPILLIPKDRQSRHSLTQALGGLQITPRITTVIVPDDSALALCTDGLDDVLGPDSLEFFSGNKNGFESMAAWGRVRQALLRSGAPDNATALIAGY